MATRQFAFLYVSASGFILLTIWLNGLSALGFQAGKSSFSPLQESLFWTSDGGNYTFGFQAVNGGTTDYLLSIWLSDDPNKTAIWWPLVSSNDDAPTVKRGAFFQFTSKGSLELHTSPSGSLLWGTNTSSSYAELSDTGNLMLFDNNTTSTSSWQSFEDNRDSLMLAGLDTITVISKLQSRRNQSSYATGRFRLQTNGDKVLQLHGLDYLGNDFVYANVQMNTRGSFRIENDIGIRYSPNSLELIDRLTLDYDGNLRIYQWQSDSSSWKMLWNISDIKCRVGSPCGPFGICQKVDADETVNCTCPDGYKAREANDPSQGCESPIIFNESCLHLTDITMEEVPNADYYLNDLKPDVSNLDLEACKQTCLNECACMAFVHIETTDEGVENCYFKGASDTGYLMNGYNSSGKTLFIKAKAITPITATPISVTHKRNQNWVIGPGVATAVLVAVGFGAWLIWRRRNNASPVLRLRSHKRKYEVAGDVGPVRFYRHDELVLATANFSEPLGRGGFGTVFKGWLAVENTGFDSIGTEETLGSNIDANNPQMRAVAVKVLRDFGGNIDVDGHNESYSQFKAEINTLGKIHHVNLVSLLGYSYMNSTTRTHTENARMLVYECMENGSLDAYLSTAQHAQLKLTWGMRYSIALGVALGMAYLHHDCSPPILHCDIKPHYILLDDNFIAKVADFGFARRVHLHHPHSHIMMSAIRGTHGYLAPEWLTSDEITFKVDVYSFGKLLLELVRGFKAAADGLTMPVVEWAVECMSKGAVMEFSMHSDVDTDENSKEIITLPHQEYHSRQPEANEKLRLLKVGMWCIQHNPSSRPTMSCVVQLIEGVITMEDPPIPPTPSKLPMSSGNQSFSPTYHYSSGTVSGR